MKVLNICHSDWANYSYMMAKALKSVGVDCESIKIQPHEFWYQEQSRLVTYREMEEEIKKYDVINYVHGNIDLFKETKHLLKGKKVIVTYTGTVYRLNPTMHNGLFNPIVDLSLTDQCEFFGLGAKNLHYAPVAMDIERYDKFTTGSNQPFIIAHYPSNPAVKGSEKILEMIKSVYGKYVFYYNPRAVKHHEQLKRMSKCDIYVELFQPEWKGKPYGCYGVTAFEAACMGKVVVTQNIRKDVYLKTFGNCPFLIANTEEDFIQVMQGLVDSTSEVINNIKTETYNWVNLNHSLTATGRYLQKLLQ